MTILSRLMSRMAHLPPAETYDVLAERDLKVPMPDGMVLLADRYAPRGVENPPLLLVRSPYGRRGIFGTAYGRLFAERGFQVVMQSIRGTFGSGGTLSPFDEHDDGLATVAWLKQQPWYPGSFLTTGGSYLGLVQWAIARDAGSDLNGMAIQESASEFRSQTYTGGAYALDATLSWTDLVMHQEHMNLLRSLLFPASRRLQLLFQHLPLRDLDKLAEGKHAAFFQEWLAHNEPGDPYWEGRGFDQTVQDISVPVHLMAGWYDIFLPWQLRDYRTLREHGQRPFLTIGPWSHTSPELSLFSHAEVIPWLQAVVRGEVEQYRKERVRIFVTGASVWRDLSDWPPPGARAQRFHLQSGRGLAPDLPAVSEPDHYRYDPADPTPSVAGPLLMGKAQPTNNRALETRADVLTYTSTPQEQDLEVIGPVQADLFVQSNREHTDFFVRLCDVDQKGISINVCDALLRVTPGNPARSPDGTLHLTFDLWPTAHCFRAGHRLRVQVSSGAHPRYARNPGSGEPLGTATNLLVADQSIYHDPSHPSALILSVTS
ncbi:CocE/NonD family hydrolase [Ktedonobacter racemifer]|uniref:Hydrolase CocE/NonD family protein n=1 Tax=Ktedonobacter racemifer DSM 44963 TaxID=485913 RepID=D6TU93_KTERA|nr:CocE/NonD family hydrolase [Ktedonobacter racemifer]EFH83994.1 hydrolase CocE/NonD family protein [Ktedonobacter racemifer DSM 44963]